MDAKTTAQTAQWKANNFCVIRKPDNQPGVCEQLIFFFSVGVYMGFINLPPRTEMASLHCYMQNAADPVSLF